MKKILLILALSLAASSAHAAPNTGTGCFIFQGTTVVCSGHFSSTTQLEMLIYWGATKRFTLGNPTSGSWPCVGITDGSTSCGTAMSNYGDLTGLPGATFSVEADGSGYDSMVYFSGSGSGTAVVQFYISGGHLYGVSRGAGY